MAYEEAPGRDYRAERDAAYHERNLLVSALSKLFPSHLMLHPEDDSGWDPEWLNIVCIDGPSGQMTWHIHSSELPEFDHLDVQPNNWDGHSTEEKYKRLEKLVDFVKGVELL